MSFWEVCFRRFVFATISIWVRSVCLCARTPSPIFGYFWIFWDHNLWFLLMIGQYQPFWRFPMTTRVMGYGHRKMLFCHFPIGAWYNGVPKLCFCYIQAIKSKNKPKLCYQKFTKFQNVFKIGPEPIFWAF